MAVPARSLPPEQPLPAPRTEPFRLRGATFHLMVLRLSDPSPERVAPAIADLFRRAPGFLRFAPVVIGLDDLDPAIGSADFPALIEALRRYQVVPIGFTGGSQSLRMAAQAAGLPPLRGSGEHDATPGAPPTEAPPTVSQTREPVAPVRVNTPAPPPVVVAPPASAPARATMVLDQSVRSGQRIYAEGADLVVYGTVNRGAEVIADGHIHIYGALRGRAIAGGMANEQARITALRFDPELVAIAGFYAPREALQDAGIDRAIQVRLEQERLGFHPIE